MQRRSQLCLKRMTAKRGQGWNGYEPGSRLGCWNPVANLATAFPDAIVTKLRLNDRSEAPANAVGLDVPAVPAFQRQRRTGWAQASERNKNED